jgi:hypothetical protein
LDGAANLDVRNVKWHSIRGTVSVSVTISAARASPGRWWVSCCLSKGFAEVWLVGESASQRDVAQGRVSLQHVLSGQLDAAPDHESARWLSEGTPEGARKMRFAEMNEPTEIPDEYPICNVTINIGTYFEHVPAGQAASPGNGRFREFGINPVTQQRGCLEYGAVSCLFVIKLTSSRIE